MIVSCPLLKLLAARHECWSEIKRVEKYVKMFCLIVFSNDPDLGDLITSIQVQAVVSVLFCGVGIDIPISNIDNDSPRSLSHLLHLTCEFG